MAVRIAIIEVTDKEKLSVPDAHQFHILHCYLGHHLVRQFVLILRLKTQGNMAYGLGDPEIHLPLELKAVNDVLC